MDDIAIKVENLTKIYKLYDKPTDRMKEALSLTKKKYSKDYYALKDISFEVKRGETVGIIGTNGSGKSTLLKIITGVLTQSSGTVEVNGKISALLELGAGFNPEYTGLENIYLNGTMMGYTKEEMDKRVKPIIDFADIGDFINQPVKTYSSGMFARLAFAVAINVDPDILIVDEALSVGDVFFRLKCFKKFDEFKQKGKTILFVSHDMSSIIKYCSRAILINKGSLLKEDKSKIVVDEYKKVLVNQFENEEPNSEDLDSEKIDNESWNKKIKINKKYLDYGNKDIQIVDYAIIDNHGTVVQNIEKSSDFTIKIKVMANKYVKDPIVAFTIKDIKGNELCGTNTMFEKKPIDSLSKNEVAEVSFTQKMMLQGGNYILSLGCTGFVNERFIVYHRMYDLLDINVVSIKNTVGVFDLDSKVNVRTY